MSAEQQAVAVQIVCVLLVLRGTFAFLRDAAEFVDMCGELGVRAARFAARWLGGGR